MCSASVPSCSTRITVVTWRHPELRGPPPALSTSPWPSREHHASWPVCAKVTSGSLTFKRMIFLLMTTYVKYWFSSFICYLFVNVSLWLLLLYSTSKYSSLSLSYIYAPCSALESLSIDGCFSYSTLYFGSRILFVVVVMFNSVNHTWPRWIKLNLNKMDKTKLEKLYQLFKVHYWRQLYIDQYSTSHTV